jgi:hypothetical protein
MKRKIFGEEISQNSKTEFFSATDIVRAGNKWRLSNGMSDFNITQYWNLKSTKEFMETVDSKYGTSVIKGRGKGNHTWVHPLVFIDMALAISPSLKLEVYEWIMDDLIRYRNDSGDSYKEMSAALHSNFLDKKAFHEYITKVADRIKLACGVKDWQSATEYQLKLRDKIHTSIRLLCNVLKDNEQAVRLGIYEYTKEK